MRGLAVLGLAATLAGCATAAPPAQPPIAGPEWRLEDLAGGGIIDNSHVTLMLGPEGRASGHGGCNRFFGSWTQTGSAISLGQMGSTKMACAEALMNQENKYLNALASAGAYSFDATGALIVTTAAGPLKFRKD